MFFMIIAISISDDNCPVSAGFYVGIILYYMDIKNNSKISKCGIYPGM
jgi:hypothetical protein